MDSICDQIIMICDKDAFVSTAPNHIGLIDFASFFFFFLIFQMHCKLIYNVAGLFAFLIFPGHGHTHTHKNRHALFWLNIIALFPTHISKLLHFSLLCHAFTIQPDLLASVYLINVKLIPNSGQFSMTLCCLFSALKI